MVRDIEGVISAHHQKSPHSAITSLAEMMLKLAGEQPPDLQSKESEGARGWTPLIDQVYGRIAFRRHIWAETPFASLLTAEISAGRPVGLVLANHLTQCGRKGELPWVAVRLNSVGPHVFVELYGKLPESGAGDGHFSEKKTMRLDDISEEHALAVVYCEELYPPLSDSGRRRRLRRERNL